MNLTAISFEEATSIRYALFREKTGPGFLDYVLVAQFRGEYRDGSGGAPDAAYIKGILETALSVWHSNRLILDFSELHYEWGDEMLDFIGPLYNNHIFALVLGPSCQKAISTLVFGLYDPKPATEKPHIFSTLEEAYAFVHDDVLQARLKREREEAYARMKQEHAERMKKRNHV